MFLYLHFIHEINICVSLTVFTKRYGSLPNGPKCGKHPADVFSNAVKVMQIATGETEEENTTHCRIGASGNT